MSLAAKLQIKLGQRIRLVNAPRGSPSGRDTSDAAADAVLVFVTDRAEFSKHEDLAVKAAREDRLAWIAYPKAGQLDTEVNREVLRKVLESKGVRPVRQVAIDATWSALSFRPARSIHSCEQPGVGT
jgi:hypothetical protein